VQLGRVFIELINAPFLNAGGTPNLSDPDDVVDFERLIELAEPLGPIGSSAPTTLIQRQFQLAQQVGDLLARRDMAHAWAGAQGCPIESSSAVSPRGKNSR
jgi:hypothetical protein